jgi:hypothetical protein
VVDWATENNIQTIKMKLDADSGWPDRMFLLPGCPAFIEFKKPKKKPAPLQHHRMEHLAGLGYRVLWTTSKKLSIDWLRILCKQRGLDVT